VQADGGRPGIRDKEQLTVQTTIDQYCDTLLQWLTQISSNLGSGFRQELFTSTYLAPSDRFENNLSRVVERQSAAAQIRVVRHGGVHQGVHGSTQR